MTSFLVARAIQMLVSLAGLTVIVFALSRMTGDPVYTILPIEATQEQYDAVREQLGLNDPLPVQYFSFVGQLLQGDLGNSIVSRTPVSGIIGEPLLATAQLGLAALMVTLVLGIPLGIYAARHRGSALDLGVRMLSVLGQAAPAFWVGIIAIMIFSVGFGVLPSGGKQGIAYFVLPALTMAWASVAGVIRLLRSSMLETMESDYIRLCRVKGLPEQKVLWKHGLRNAGLPVLTFGGVMAANLITGSVVTETVFVWPGMGRLLVSSIESRDFPVAQACILILAIIYIVINMFIDVTYALLNPRLRSA